MPHSPYFSIVLATYNRGQHIIPTIQSVLQQTFGDFELIVVGDGCTDGTEQAVSAFDSDWISWRNLAANSGSQSAPNNEGLRCARGRWIAYIGHDDIWAPNHLACLQALTARNETDFAVSGCLYYGPADSETYFVTGLFTESAAATEQFFPPSSFAHRRDVVDRIGAWRDARSIVPPPDCDFLLRAARGGLKFVSTGRVTVHKFASGHRYLAYLRPSGREQQSVLNTFGAGGEQHTERLVDSLIGRGSFLGMRYPDFAQYRDGQLFNLNRSNKGLDRPPLRRLSELTVLEQSGEPRALDWHGLETAGRPYRWSGPNPRPKILLPFTGARACVAIQIAAVAPGAKLETVSVQVEERKVDHHIESRADGSLWLSFVALLSLSDYTIVTLNVPETVSARALGRGDDRRLGVAVADIVLEPLP